MRKRVDGSCRCHHAAQFPHRLSPSANNVVPRRVNAGQPRNRNAAPKFVIVYSPRLLSHFTCLERTHRLTMSIISLVNPPGRQPMHLPSFTSHYPPVYAGQTRSVGQGSWPPITADGTISSLSIGPAAAISDNYRGMVEGTGGVDGRPACASPKRKAARELNAKLNSSSGELLTKIPFSLLPPLAPRQTARQ